MSRSARLLLALAAAAVALAAPAAASAHSRSPTIALDVRLTVHSLLDARVQVIDGNRRLRLTVDPPATLEVRGLLGEPFLRFSRDGVWANLSSPTTAADRIAQGRHGSGWIRVASGRSYTWHDHRLAPPRGLDAGSTAPFALPVFLDGDPRTIEGVFVAVSRPTWWPWLAAAALALAAVVVVARRAPSWRSAAAWASAAAAAAAALVASVAFATGGSFAGSLWVVVGACCALVLAAAAGLLGRRTFRTWTASLVGAAALVLTLRDVVVFWHGVLISSLSPTLTRAAVAVALAAGLAAAGVSLTADDGEPARS